MNSNKFNQLVKQLSDEDIKRVHHDILNNFDCFMIKNDNQFGFWSYLKDLIEKEMTKRGIEFRKVNYR